MKQQLEHRLAQLKSEFQSGQNLLAELDAKAASTRETLLRISGAIQVLEEMVAKEHESSGNGTHPSTDEVETIPQETS